MNYYPRGKLKADDEGAALIKITSQDKTVIIDFGKEMTWLGMDTVTATTMANILLDHVKRINEKEN